VKKALSYLLRWLYLFAVTFSAVYLTMHHLRQTVWYKNRLYHQLLGGSRAQQQRAAGLLARLGGEDQLLAALQSQSPSARELGQRALEHLWLNVAGHEAYQLVQSAYRATEQKEHTQALSILNRVVQKYPHFAEGWNRRASTHWDLGDYDQSVADAQRALALNPNHYAAWQGLGLCRLQQGQIAEACRCLRAALKILPFDAATQGTLQQCDSLLRRYPPPIKKEKNSTVI
jgi:tetratricopeptide (TPR) repeat protein